ncbi:hypothetical protein ACFLTT_01510 [Chloroflexota bacterium]
MWWKKKKVCGYWDCNKRIIDDQILCNEHQERMVRGTVNQCPECDRFKDVMYNLCLDCYYGRSVNTRSKIADVSVPEGHGNIEFSEAWTDGFMEKERYFVYILEFGGGVLYVGHAQKLHEEIAAHMERKSSIAVGSNPKLQYVEILANRESAEMREIELKRLIETNPQQISLMIETFKENLNHLDLT